MQDIFEHNIVCKNCSRQTSRTKTFKDSFELRAWECQKCNSIIYHPTDIRDYQDYQKLRKQNFNVKLRMVGNSFCVSIPREIIDFHQQMQQEIEQKINQKIKQEMVQELNQLVRLSLEEPGKIGLFFFEKRRHTSPDDAQP